MTRKKKRVIIVLSVLLTLLLAFSAWVIWSNKALELNSHTLKYKDLPDEFDGFRIAQVSDLHNAQMGDNNEKLLEMIEEADPDMIALTGDLIDARNTDVKVALDFAENALKIAPCYFVTGNHEARSEEYDKLKKGLLDLGVVVLENAAAEIERDGEKITVIGANDPSSGTDYMYSTEERTMQSFLKDYKDNDGNFTLLLSHRPELFNVYADNNVDLVLSGHAHGGQIRLPFLGGLFAPNQGMLPDYDAGKYSKGGTTMIVSRGIGNSAFPVRFNNRPEVVLIELEN